jgi:hypothetical protein
MFHVERLIRRPLALATGPAVRNLDPSSDLFRLHPRACGDAIGGVSSAAKIASSH